MESPPLLNTNPAQYVIASALAEAFLAGPWDLDGLVDRSTRILGRRYRWLRPLAACILAQFTGVPRPRHGRLATFVRDDVRFAKACVKHHLTLRFTQWPAPLMAPAPGPPSTWPVPALISCGELARFLDLELSELDWFADCQARERTAATEALRHYRYRWINKPSGSQRLIEAPKPRLKQIQRRLLDEILVNIPPHDAAHGFRPGRSVMSFVEPHVGQSIVLKMDLRDFFASIPSARVMAIYLTVGYPEPVARLLSGLCTNTVPVSVSNQTDLREMPGSSTSAAYQARQLYSQPHVPQGAPTSPALANLAAYRLDNRLAGLASAAQARYTRYADDLLFSGGESLARSIPRFPTHVAAIALEEGFAVQHRKTRVMRQSVRQRAAGIVINRKINVARDDFDRLKAILHNCARHGPRDQNREGIADFRAQLAGKVAHAIRLSPGRGDKLQRLFDRIAW